MNFSPFDMICITLYNKMYHLLQKLHVWGQKNILTIHYFNVNWWIMAAINKKYSHIRKGVISRMTVPFVVGLSSSVKLDWIVNTYSDNFYKVTFLNSVGVK